MHKILLDTDIGKFSDDIIALLFALKHPQAELKGITTVGEYHKEGADCAKEMVECAKKNIPVYNKDNAADFLAREINSHKREYDLVAIGPLTNIASAMAKEPDLLEKVNATYIMGGGVYRSYDPYDPFGNYTPEYNFAQDTKAAQTVISAKGNKVLVPLDATMYARIKKEELKKLRELGELERKAYELSSLYLFTEEMHDALALMALTTPEIFEKGIKKMPISIRDDGVVLIKGTET